MGSSSSKKSLLPKIGIDLTTTEIRDIIKENTYLEGSQVKISDDLHFAITFEDQKKFILMDISKFIKYKKNSFDCDDFSLISSGLEHFWFKLSINDKGSTYGIIYGDIRDPDHPDEPRSHAMNFFIDSEKQFYLVEPQNGKIYKPVPSSRFTFAMI